jgi:hypothetical protein
MYAALRLHFATDKYLRGKRRCSGFSAAIFAVAIQRVHRVQTVPNICLMIHSFHKVNKKSLVHDKKQNKFKPEN